MQYIQKLEAEHGVKVLWAIESGSRAWAFESKDSDYDIRGVFCANDKSTYASIFPRTQGALQGFSEDRLYDWELWPVDKAVVRLFEGNPIIVEWLLSKEVYQAHLPSIKLLRGLLDRLEPTPGLLHHYRSMAISQWKSFMEGRPIVNLKKYLYCVRPVVMIHWLLHRQAQSAPKSLPVLIIDVMQTLDILNKAGVISSSIRTAVEGIVSQKRNLTESGGECEHIPELDDWIQASITQAEAYLDSLNGTRTASVASAAADTDSVSGFARQVQALDRKVYAQLQSTSRAAQSIKLRSLVTQLANNTLGLVLLAEHKRVVVSAALSDEELLSCVGTAIVGQDEQSALLRKAVLAVARAAESTVWSEMVPLIREWATNVRARLEAVLHETAACESARRQAAELNAPVTVTKESLQREFDAEFQKLLQIAQ
jgi:predicted nucleotidyltransferase